MTRNTNNAPAFMSLRPVEMATTARRLMKEGRAAIALGMSNYMHAVAALAYQDTANEYKHMEAGPASRTVTVKMLAALDLGALNGRSAPEVYKAFIRRAFEVLVFNPAASLERTANAVELDDIASQKTQIQTAVRTFIDVEACSAKPGTGAALECFDKETGLMQFPAPLYAPLGYEVNTDLHGAVIPADGRKVYLRRVKVPALGEDKTDSKRPVEGWAQAHSSWLRIASLSRSRKRVCLGVDGASKGTFTSDNYGKADKKPAPPANGTGTGNAGNGTGTNGTGNTNAGAGNAGTGNTNTNTNPPAGNAARGNDRDATVSVPFDVALAEVAKVLATGVNEPILPTAFTDTQWKHLQAIATEVARINANGLAAAAKDKEAANKNKSRAA